MHYVSLVIAFFLLTAASRDVRGQEPPAPSSWLEINAQSIPIYEGFDAIEPILRSAPDTLHIINFWATWCAPCVKELPYFDEIAARKDTQAVRVTLVNLDFRKQLTKRLVPFLRDRKLHARVVVLDDPDANSWIDRVDPSWSGAIPATLFLTGDRSRTFREGLFTRPELHALVDSLMRDVQ